MIDRNKLAFRKMKKNGMFTPPLIIYDQARRLLKDYFFKILLEYARLIKEAAKNNDVIIDKSGQVKDSFLSYVMELKNKLTSLNPEYKEMKNKLRGLLNKTQKSFFKQLYADSDEKLNVFLMTSSLQKEDVFHDRITDIRELYVDSAIQRIKGEVDELKKMFLEELTDWIEGRTDKLDLEVIMNGMKKTSIQESKFFARDQFLKFNKSLSIATLKQAGVKKVKWLTANDLAVRGNPSGPYKYSKSNHYKLNNQIFDINDIPKEFWDYNCRCILVPVWE